MTTTPRSAHPYLTEVRTAQEQGYLLCDTRERREAIMRYVGWANRYGVPWILVHYPQSKTAKYVHIELDLPGAPDCPTCLGAIRALLAEFNHGKRYCANPGYCYASRIPRAHAAFVAGRLSEMAIRLLHCRGGAA